MSENTKTVSAGIKLAVFVAVTSLVTGILAVALSNTRFGDTRTYNAIFTDVAGLNTNDEVRVAGVRVGQVESIKLYQGKLAEVSFSVTKSGLFAAGIPASTLAQVRYR